MSRMYYGWRVVAALFIAGFMVYGGGLYCFVLFLPRITAELGWSRAATSGLVSAFWLSAPLILLGGRAIRRFGPGRLLVAGILLEAACVCLLALVSSLWQMYALRILMGLGKVAFAVTLPDMVSRWFRRRYALALGITWAGFHVGGLVLAPVASAIIDAHGWRTACFAIGVGLVTLALIPVLLALRVDSPAALGLELDGEPAAAVTPASPPALEPVSGSVGAVVRAPVFWLIALVTVLYYSTYGGLLAHEAAIVEGAGFTPHIASLVLGSMAGVAAISGLTAGWLLDRGAFRAVSTAVHAVLLTGAIALYTVAETPSTTALVLYAVTFGASIGAADVYFVALLRRRFPTIGVAYLYSAWYFCELGTLLIAPVVAGWMYDLTGHYGRALLFLAGTAAAAFAIGILLVGRPRASGVGAVG